MKIIVGLGNPGSRYASTVHNLGFQVVDELARRWGLRFQEQARAKADVAEGVVAGQSALLVKPATFMNLSGESVSVLTRQRELGEDDLLVITDDVTLPIGRIRIRPRGSHGGHNGLRSIVERLGHENFTRLRVGVKPPWEVDDLVRFVLSKLPPLEQNQMAEMVEVGADASESWVRQGTGPTADQFNGLRRFAEPR